MPRHCELHNKRKASHATDLKDELAKRLNLIEGQIRGIKSMIAADTYCDDVLTQISAARSALSAVANSLFEAHLKSCVTEQYRMGNYAVTDELLGTIRRMMK